MQVYFSSLTITICSVYLPPNVTNTNLNNALLLLKQQLPYPFLICADINAHHISWGSPYSDARGRIVADWLQQNNLSLLNDGSPTYLSSQGRWSHIDLTIASPSLAPQANWHVNPHPFHSDHYPIITKLGAIHTSPGTPQRWIIHEANWTKFKKILKLPATYTSPTEACRDLEEGIISAATQSIPLSSGLPSNHPKCCWWTPECSKALKNKKHSFNQYKRHFNSISHWIAYKRDRAIFRNTVFTARKTSWKTFVSSITSNTSSSDVWRKIRQLRSAPPQPTIVLNQNNNTVTLQKEVAIILAEEFTNRGHHTGPFLSIVCPDRKKCSLVQVHNSSLWFNNPFTVAELQSALATVSTTSPGPDNIPFDFILNFTSVQLTSLLGFYNYLWDNGLPQQWKYSLTIPILKPNKPSFDPSSYRPIALTNCLCKLMEKMVTSRLNQFLAANNSIDPRQSGFRASYSTLDALTRLETAARLALIQDDSLVVVFIDITQAFDSVWHHGLLHKLHSFGLTGNLPKFIQNFLENRKTSVRLGNIISPPYAVNVGVPQGSVISPTLFNIMINGIIQNSTEIDYSLYADDCAIWVRRRTIQECITVLQSTLDSVMQWSQNWGLGLSSTKTKAMIFTRRRRYPKPSLSLNGSPLSFVTSYRFLGIIVDHKLTWKNHIYSLRDRCQKDLRILTIVSACGWGADFLTLRKLYISLVRSKLDYASFLFSSSPPTYCKVLDRVQYAAARIMLGVLRCSPTDALEAEADLMPLAIRRKLLLVQYVTRVLSVPEHPCRSLLLSYYPYDFYKHQKLPLPVIAHAHTAFSSLKLTFQQISVTSSQNRYKVFSLPVHSTIQISTKAALSSEKWQALFSDLLRLHPDRTQIYTDGSLLNKLCGSAVWSTSFSLLACLPSNTTVFAAELYAIYMCLSFLKNKSGQYTIFTDSYSSIQTLQNLKRSSHYLAFWIANILKEAPVGKFIIEWVPGHMGILGNERADALARQATSLTCCSSLPLHYSELNRYFHSHYHSLWKSTWALSPSQLLPIKPDLGLHDALYLPRKQQILITRLRLRTCIFTHQHFFTNSPPSLCSQCSLRLTIPHVLLLCPAFAAPRELLRNACASINRPLCMQTVLSATFPSDVLLKYLQEIDYSDKI